MKAVGPTPWSFIYLKSKDEGFARIPAHVIPVPFLAGRW